MVKVLIKSLISGMSSSGGSAKSYQSGGSSTKSGTGSDQSLGKSQSAADRRDGHNQDQHHIINGLPQADNDDNTTWIEKESMNATSEEKDDANDSNSLDQPTHYGAPEADSKEDETIIQTSSGVIQKTTEIAKKFGSAVGSGVGGAIGFVVGGPGGSGIGGSGVGLDAADLLQDGPSNSHDEMFLRLRMEAAEVVM